MYVAFHQNPISNLQRSNCEKKNFAGAGPIPHISVGYGPDHIQPCVIIARSNYSLIVAIEIKVQRQIGYICKALLSRYETFMVYDMSV